jgi:hypothetical protein
MQKVENKKHRKIVMCGLAKTERCHRLMADSTTFQNQYTNNTH